jgi:hypothetical protein
VRSSCCLSALHFPLMGEPRREGVTSAPDHQGILSDQSVT